MRFNLDLNPDDWAKIEAFADEVRSKMQNCKVKIATHNVGSLFTAVHIVATGKFNGEPFGYEQRIEPELFDAEGYAEHVATGIAIELGHFLFFKDGQQ
jgi:hypothetical protein